MSVTPRSTLRQRLFAFLAAGIGGTLAAAMSFAMTVYEVANPNVIPNVEAGSPIDTGRWIVTSDPDEALAQIKPYLDAGLNHLVFHGPGDDQERFLAQFAEDVLPKLRALA